MGYVDMQNVRALWHMIRFMPADLVLNNLNTACSTILLLTPYIPNSPAAPHIPHASNPNRWCLVLVLSNALRLRLEVVPSETGLALVKLDQLPPAISRRTLDPRDVFWMTLELQQPGTTVMDILNILITNALHQYKFTRAGQGQREWIRAVVFHLEDSGILQNGSQESMDRVIHRQWWSPGVHIGTVPVVAGEFYKCYGCETGRRQYCDHDQTFSWADKARRRRQNGFY
ncbi:hypothetical protein CALCODRAFT_557527 [Calocera cornea HHB12733]|uniref:DUF7770 domain-containing protein n=1 Tax=Calocera cornea HHB12733 TaxID=1353952 RepID=A0A165DSC7_9BASI|nr:hypothetical protein CALCODRAFT_557527 [Calocera cornea HHB12733]